jgi:hypothetical protein
MKYDELIRQFKKNIELRSYGSVREIKRNYDLFKIVIDNRFSKTLLITSGFHGEEFNGPVSLLGIIKEVIDYAKKKKINLLIYPCVNPSGFDLKKRYNASNEEKNNDFLRYEIKKGEWIDVVKPGKKFLRYKLVDSPAKEVRALQKDLRKFGKVPVGVLDIHQDNELPKCDFYAYVLDKFPAYRKIMAELDQVGRRCRSIKPRQVKEGYEFDDTINREGFIITHDGTITDMFWRFGSAYSVTAETNTETPLEKVAAINKLWIKELIDLISAGKAKDFKLNIKY